MEEPGFELEDQVYPFKSVGAGGGEEGTPGLGLRPSRERSVGDEHRSLCKAIVLNASYLFQVQSPGIFFAR